MSAELQKQIDVLTSAVISLTEMMGARITRDQMLERLRVSSNTLTAGVRDGRFPKPANDGKWLLAEIIEWERNRA